MTDNIQHINVDDEQWDGTPRALREHVDKLQKALKERDQQITEFRDNQTASALSGVLAGFSKPERVKSALLGDKVNPLDTEAVAKWLEENGDDFARAQTPAETPQENDPQETVQVPDYGRLNAPASVGQPSGVDPAQIVNSAPADLSPEKLRQWFVDRGI